MIDNQYIIDLMLAWQDGKIKGMSLNDYLYIATGWTEEQIEDWVMTGKMPNE